MSAVQSRGQRPDRVDGDHPHAQALLRQPPREVELRDVAAEEVAQVERRDEHVHASRSVVAHGEAQRRHLLGQRAQRRVADRAGARPRIQRGRRDGVQAPAALRFVARREGERAAPRERVEQHPLRPERLGTAPRQIARAARREPGDRRRRALGARERGERAALGGRHPVAAAQLEHGGELQQPAGVDEVVHAPQPDPLARVAAHRGGPLPQPGHPVRRLVPERRAAVLDVVVERPVDEPDLAGGERAEGEPVVVEVRELGRREGQRVVEQVAREQRRGPGHRVRHEQGEQIGVVVAAPAPVRAGAQPAVLADDAGVAVDEPGVAELGAQRRELVRDARRRPGRPARRSGTPPGASASARSKLR